MKFNTLFSFLVNKINKKPAFMMNMLDVSTCHLTEETLGFLQEQANISSGTVSFIVYEKSEYGFIFPVFLEENNDLPYDLQELIAFGHKQHADWIMLDADGYIHDDELARYE